MKTPLIEQMRGNVRQGEHGLTVNEGGEVATFSVVSLMDGTALVRLAWDGSIGPPQVERNPRTGFVEVSFVVPDTWRPRS